MPLQSAEVRHPGSRRPVWQGWGSRDCNRVSPTEGKRSHGSCNPGGTSHHPERHSRCTVRRGRTRPERSCASRRRRRSGSCSSLRSRRSSRRPGCTRRQCRHWERTRARRTASPCCRCFPSIRSIPSRPPFLRWCPELCRWCWSRCFRSRSRRRRARTRWGTPTDRSTRSSPGTRWLPSVSSRRRHRCRCCHPGCRPGCSW